MSYSSPSLLHEPFNNDEVFAPGGGFPSHNNPKAAAAASANDTKNRGRRGGFGSNLRRWVALQLATDKSRRKSKGDLRKAEKAMSAAEDMICGIEEALREEEKSLQRRAVMLRRQSMDAFKIMSDIKRTMSADNAGFLHGEEEEEEEEEVEVEKPLGEEERREQDEFFRNVFQDEFPGKSKRGQKESTTTP